MNITFMECKDHDVPAMRRGHTNTCIFLYWYKVAEPPKDQHGKVNCTWNTLREHNVFRMERSRCPHHASGTHKHAQANIQVLV